MNIKFGFCIVAVLTLLTVACNKDKELIPEGGIYRGVFSRILPGDDTVGTGVVFFALIEGSSTFSLQGDTSSNAPYSCAGIYALASDRRIIFHNNAFIEETGSDPFYDPQYILDSLYSYIYTDTSFMMELNMDGTRYNYNLSPY